MQKNNPWFLHADLDAFFASVEQLDHPEYRGKPVIVGGKPEDKRSVVSTCSYEARKFGVHSAMPTFKAYKLCPQGIFVHGRMERYAELSKQVMDIFKEFSPDVDQMSIDEASIDLTGTEQLFGPPDEVAAKIKKLVKEKTGLTISLGLAPTKYLAKISSDINKPDGFYMVKPGEEEEFMLNLPLKKIWGIGKKTQEVLAKSGIRTTRDIHERPLDVLQFMYGNNMGSFLYHVVRGIEVINFERKTSSHSISSETTFVEDITDPYIIETKILELCHGLIFRLLSEHSYSKTVMIKIRYEDFSTVSIRRTVDYNILTLDDFFALAKELFNEKYDHKTGIRLIGVGLENLQDKPLPQQLDLFEDNNERKQSVEKAILNLERKHPEIKVHKARLLKDIEQKTKIFIFALILLAATCGKANVFAQSKNNVTDSKGAAALLPDTLDTESEPTSSELSKTETKTDSTDNTTESNDSENKNSFSLFNWNIPDSGIDYDIKGYWSSEVTGSIISTFGNGNPFAFSFGSPVFKQEVDLSADFQITDNWYFNLEFADTFSKNTYTLGYKNEGYLTDFIFSNRNITFPNYSSNLTGYSLSGGENQAPGLYFHLNDKISNRWTGDLMLRYDMTSSKEAVFYGKSSATDFKQSLSAFIYGKVFVIPSKEILLDVDSVYVESAKGTFKDQYGRKYKKLDETEFQIISASNLLLLSSSAESQKKNNKVPAVLLTFKNEANASALISEIGHYSNASTYLGQIQTYFNSENSLNINLENYTSSLLNTIQDNGRTISAIQIQAENSFSPFLFCGIYDCGIIAQADASVVSAYSGITIPDYYADTQSSTFDLGNENYFYENHLYAEVGKNSAKNLSYITPQQRYPFADKNPFAYLSDTETADLMIQVRTYSQISHYDIGKKASSGSVKAYINGIIDGGAKYEASSGFVTLSREVSDSDKIYITWQEENEDAQNGAVSFAAGYKYNILPNLSADLSFTTSWPLSPFATYANSNISLSGFAAATGGISFEFDDLKLKDGLSLALSNKNLSGIYMAFAPNETVSQTYYLSSSIVYETKTVPSLNIDSAPLLEIDNNGTVLPITGKGDSSITGYKIPLSWDFTSLDSSNNNWASVDLKLSAGELLCNASQLEIAIKPEEALEGVDVYLQLGIKAEKTFTGETSDFIPTWKLTGSDDSRIQEKLDLSKNEWQIIKVQLTHSDRAKLVSSKDLRLIVVSNSETFTEKASISIGPYEPVIQGSFTESHNSTIISSSIISTKDSPSTKKNIKNQDTSGTKITWLTTDSNLSSQDYLITTATYFDYSDISSYKTVNLDFKINGISTENTISSEDYGFIYILDSAAEALDENGNIALELKISSSIIQNLLETNSDNWNTLSINTKTKEVSLNGKTINSGNYSLKLNKSILPSRQKIILNTALNNKLYDTGTFVLGNLYYKESEPDFTSRNYFSAEYKKDDLWQFDKINLNLSSTQEASIGINDTKPAFGINGTLNDDFSIWNMNFGTTLLFSADSTSKNKNAISEASHYFKTVKPVFGILNFTENYVHNPADKELEKSNNLTLNLSKLYIPASVYFTSTVKNKSSYINQNTNAGTNILIPIKDFNLKIDFTSDLSQKISSLNTSELSNPKEYFSDYGHAFLMEFSPGLSNADSRSESFGSTISLTTPFFKMTPTLKYNLTGQYKNASTQSFMDTSSFSFTLPISLNKNNFNFTIVKTGKNKTDIFTLNNYQSDIEYLFKTQSNNNWFYTAIPFADLFVKNISDKMDSGNSSYSSKYEVSWRRSLSNTIMDFYLPLSTSLSLSRDITATDTISDYYQVKIAASNAFINMLGSQGKLKLFKWFSQDEFTSNFTSVLKIPTTEPENTTLIISCYNSLLMYITDSNTVKVGADFSISTDSDWKIRTTGIWTHSGNDSFILKIPQFFFKELDLSNQKITRKETLNITLSDDDKILSQTYEINHNCTVKMNKDFSLTVGIGLNLKLKENAAATLATEYSIGGNLKF